jgi:hypothetical protein
MRSVVVLPQHSYCLRAEFRDDGEWTMADGAATQEDVRFGFHSRASLCASSIHN